MSYLPRPEAARAAQDVDEIYALTAEALQRAQTPDERRAAFRAGLLQAYEAGVDAMRELVQTYSHDRPTPIPPPPGPGDLEAPDDPGTLPPDKPRQQTPNGGWRGPRGT